MEVYAFLEAQANSEVYPDRELEPRVVERALATTAAVVVAIGSCSSKAEGFELSESPTLHFEKMVDTSNKSSQDDLIVIDERNISTLDISEYRSTHLSEGNWVFLTQRALSDKGYFDGPITGYYGPLTTDAVAAFQADAGLPATGEMDNASKVALFDGAPTEKAKAEVEATPKRQGIFGFFRKQEDKPVSEPTPEPATEAVLVDTKTTNAQLRPLSDWTPEELLGGEIPDNGRSDGTAHYINDTGVNSHQYWRESTGSAHKGVDLLLPIGHPVYAVGTRVVVWWDSYGGGLSMDQEHPNMPGVWVRSLHLDSAFDKGWEWYKANPGEQWHNIEPENLGHQVIGTVGSTGAHGAGDYGPHSHTGLFVTGSNDYGQERDKHDDRYLIIRTNMLHLVHWGLQDKYLVSQGPAAYDDVNRADQINPEDVQVIALATADSEASDSDSQPLEIDSVAATVAEVEPPVATPVRAQGIVGDAVAAAPAVDSFKPLKKAMFEGGQQSLVARAVGAAEGTRTPKGGFTKHYEGHVDPGNGVWNLGSFSYQHHNKDITPEEADKRQLARLENQAAEMIDIAKAYGMQLTQSELLNGIDLANQAPAAALDYGGYIDNLYEAKVQLGKTGQTAIIHARVEAYKDPNTGKWAAPGLGNTWASIYADQVRRMDEVTAAMDYTGAQPDLLISVYDTDGPAVADMVDSAASKLAAVGAATSDAVKTGRLNGEAF
ncbi:peptidoglycan-binding protein [Pseudanabaena sp. FACHB-2040]|uniref:peptidoglycan-binding protein n=1 Tax=Pseudanabaena sp. FACHB-2040 TaxID=2692859 RepID=UPI0018F02CA9|nr:peptidoglycan-binding protein [Pseudanabaena sp. FACHB-2040]